MSNNNPPIEEVRTIRTHSRKKGNKVPVVDMAIESDLKAELFAMKLDGDSVSDVVRMLINVFNEPDLKDIYDKREIANEYYHRALVQRKLDKMGAFEDKLEKAKQDTGTRPLEKKYIKSQFDMKGDKYLPLSYKHYTPQNMETREVKYLNRLVMMLNDYDVETIANLQYLMGLHSPKQVLMNALRFTYMIFSQDRLVRNSNAEIAEHNMNVMIENATLNKDPIIPIYKYERPKMGREIMDALKEEYGVRNTRLLLKELVQEAWEDLQEKRGDNE